MATLPITSTDWAFWPVSAAVPIAVLKVAFVPPFKAAAGFIGLYFRITNDDSAFESIYLRPKVGRINKQYARNHAVQYFSFPDYKFQTLRDKFPAGTYEGSAPVALNEWITMRLEINGDMAEMFINDLKYS
ncbi:MAG: hypothetical protein MUF24_06970, partial [Chitinophagaceae bacterium]|nr:hypothetical protein [Chitinophagaceae bacterium]